MGAACSDLLAFTGLFQSVNEPVCSLTQTLEGNCLGNLTCVRSSPSLILTLTYISYILLALTPCMYRSDPPQVFFYFCFLYLFEIQIALSIYVYVYILANIYTYIYQLSKYNQYGHKTC